MNGRNEMNIPEYNVQVRVKNNYFLRRMAEKGFASNAALARACDVNVYRIGLYINLKRAPLTENNEWREDILRISAALNCMPDDLFPAQIGKEFGLSMVRIRQIIKGTERHLLRKLVGTNGCDDGSQRKAGKELLDDLTEMNR